MNAPLFPAAARLREILYHDPLTGGIKRRHTARRPPRRCAMREQRSMSERPPDYSSWPRAKQDAWFAEHGGEWDDPPPWRAKRKSWAPNGEDPLPPPPDRSGLSLSAWLDLEIPPRDHLLGALLCTTSRLMLIGETGIGKTLCGMEMSGAMASGNGALGWTGQRIARVMYLDGEMPIETFKERAIMVAERHGRGIPFYGYNRDRLGDGAMPPLNTEPGQKWLLREIETIKPDAIFFDSIMSLLTGDLMTPDAWQPMLSLVRDLSKRRIAQTWLHHANDSGKGFGTKTREWEMDAVAGLSKVEDNDEAIKWEFTKTRLRTPQNRDQFLPRIIYPNDEWKVEIMQKGFVERREESTQKTVTREFANTYDRLADGIIKGPGFDGKPVSKVKVDAIRDEMKNRGFIDPADATSRSHFARAKVCWLANKMAEADGFIWKV
jgi:hypothetical protein